MSNFDEKQGDRCWLDMEVWSGGRMVGGDPGVSGHRQMCDAQMAEMVSRDQIESLQRPTTRTPSLLGRRHPVTLI